MEINNDAKRLYDILIALRNANSNLSTSIVLSNVFGIENKPIKLMHAVVQLHDLVFKVIEYTNEKTKLPIVPLMRYLPQLEQAVSFTSFDVTWQNYQGRISPECLLVLEMVAHVEGVEQDEEITISEIADITKELDDLFDYVVSLTDIDKKLRHFILRQVEAIRRAVQEFRISGSDGFRHYLESLVFDIPTYKEAIKANGQSTQEVVGKFGAILRAVVVFTSKTKEGIAFVKNLKESFTEWKNLLPAPPSGGDVISDVPEFPTNNESA